MKQATWADSLPTILVGILFATTAAGQDKVPQSTLMPEMCPGFGVSPGLFAERGTSGANQSVRPLAMQHYQGIFVTDRRFMYSPGSVARFRAFQAAEMDPGIILFYDIVPDSAMVLPIPEEVDPHMMWVPGRPLPDH